MPEAGLVDEAESLLNEAKSCDEVSYVDAYIIANNTLVVENTRQTRVREVLQSTVWIAAARQLSSPALPTTM